MNEQETGKESIIITCQRCTSPVERDGDNCPECQTSIDTDRAWRAEQMSMTVDDYTTWVTTPVEQLASKKR